MHKTGKRLSVNGSENTKNISQLKGIKTKMFSPKSEITAIGVVCKAPVHCVTQDGLNEYCRFTVVSNTINSKSYNEFTVWGPPAIIVEEKLKLGEYVMVIAEHKAQWVKDSPDAKTGKTFVNNSARFIEWFDEEGNSLSTYKVPKVAMVRPPKDAG